MPYICLENNQVVSLLDYPPNVPETVLVIEISIEDYEKLESGAYFFNIEKNLIEPMSQSTHNTPIDNLRYQEFLNSTDWKVLRHIREKALGIASSLSDEEYLALEHQRHLIAARIV